MLDVGSPGSCDESMTTIRAAGAHELLAYIPYRLRFHPRESVVLIGLRPPEGEVGIVARIDLRDLADIENSPTMADTLVRCLVADGADAAFIAVYTDASLRNGAPGLARAAVEHCREAVESVLDPPQVWQVSATGYADVDCRDPRCCPEQGRDLRALSSGLVGAEMVARGIWAAGSRDERMRIPEAPRAARAEAECAALQARARRAASGACGETTERGRAFDAWLRACSVAHQSAVVGPVLVGEVAAGLDCVAVRDAALLSMVPGAGDLARATAGGADVEAATGEVIAAIIDPRHGVEPPAATQDAQRVLEAVVAHGQGLAAALTLLAFIAWWSGDGPTAVERAATALEIDPGYRLAHLLDGALRAGVPPGWVRAQA